MSAFYDAVFFDVDGTLIDSAPGISQTFAHTFRVLGIPHEDMDYRQFFGPPLRKSYAKYLPDKAGVERAVELYREYYKEIGQHLCTVYPGAAQMLCTLRQAGVRLYTATSKPVEVVTPILHEQGIFDLFDEVGGASMDASIDTKTEVIRDLLRRQPIAGKKILMVGDRRDDMEGARDCGLAAAGVLYGYGGREELAAFHPLYLAHNCAELTDYIIKGECLDHES